MMKDTNRLNGKDLINIGLFTAIYCAASIVIFMLGFIPFFLPFYTVFIPVFSGIVFMLFLTKVRKFGMILLMGILLGLIMLLTGMSFYALIVGSICALISEFIYRSGSYKSAGKAILTNGVFSIWIWSNFLPLFLNPDAYFSTRSFGDEYVQTIQRILPLWMCPVLLISCFVFGLLGGLAGKAILKKHFVKAGIA